MSAVPSRRTLAALVFRLSTLCCGVIALAAGACAPRVEAGSAAPIATGTARAEEGEGASARALEIHVFPDYEIHAPAGADITEAREEMDHAVTRFRQQFDETVFLAVMLFESSADMARYDLHDVHARGIPHLSWFLGEEPEGLEGRRALSHEACHVMATRRARARGNWTPATRAPLPEEITYGAQNLPDWMDEALAISCEYPVTHQKRVELLRTARMLPLDSLFAMEHPGLPEIRRLVAEAQGVSGVTRGNSVADLTTYYAQIQSLERFIRERAGTTALAQLADGLLECPIEEALDLVPGLPDSVAALEAEWMRWHQSTYR